MFGSDGQSLGDQIGQHMDRNPGDWSVEFMFGEIGAFDCSIARFAKLARRSCSPPLPSRERSSCGRSPPSTRYLRATDTSWCRKANSPATRSITFRRLSCVGSAGDPKNLIFASRGPKPEIGFADAINNDIVILSGEESCLVYDRPISASNGLFWSELVAWWSEVARRGQCSKSRSAPSTILGFRRGAQALRYLLQDLSSHPR